MAWDKDKPAVGTTLQNSNPEILANQAAIEATLPSVASGAGHPLGGDGTAGRVLRNIRLNIENGTNATTLKCTVISVWNGDAIAETDNIAKNATTGDFSLAANGATLTIEASGLTGNAVMAFGVIFYNASGTDVVVKITAPSNDIALVLYNSTTGALLDLTTLVDTGNLYFHILYITSA